MWEFAFLRGLRYSILVDVSPEEKRLIFPFFYLGPVEVLSNTMMWCWGIRCLIISNQIQLSLLRSDPTCSVLKRNLIIYFTCCKTAWITGGLIFLFWNYGDFMINKWQHCREKKKKSTISRYLLARIPMFLCLWFHNDTSCEHPMWERGRND